MKRSLGNIFLLIFSFSLLSAQQTATDSLIRLTSRLTGDALTRTYYELSLALRKTNPDSALYFANQAELILQKSDPENLLPLLYKSKGKIYEVKMVTDRSLFYYQKAYDAFIKLEEYPEIGECALRIGNIYYDVANFSEAYFYYMQSLNAYEREGDQLGIARMQNNLGIVAHDMGKLPEAEKHYFNAYEIYRNNDLYIEEAGALGNIGLILYDKEQYDSALVYFNEVMDMLKPDSVTNETERYILSGVYNNSALAYSELGRQREALRYLWKGIHLARQGNDLYNLGSVFNNLGSLYGEMGVRDSALYYLHHALRIAKKREFRHLELEVYNELARVHAGMGNYASAYNWQLRYDTVYKDLFNENQSEQIARLRARYEQEISDKEIEQLLSESQVQKMLNKAFIIFIVIIVVLVIVIAINLGSKKRTNQMLAERNLQISSAVKKLSDSENELQKMNQSKDRIFSVVAHDLRNPVAAVTGFSELLYDNFDQFPVETQKEYLLQILQGTQRIQNLLENLLMWARSQMKAVQYEPESLKVKALLEECIREMKANLDHKQIECRLKIPSTCTIFADKAMIRTVFRNLISNAIKFSFPGGRIRITAESDSTMCNVRVSDDGIGIQPEIQEKLFNSDAVVSTPGTTGESGSGLGLVICKEFVELNGGVIRVESEPGNGSTFSVGLQVNRRP